MTAPPLDPPPNPTLAPYPRPYPRPHSQPRPSPPPPPPAQAYVAGLALFSLPTYTGAGLFQVKLDAAGEDIK